MSLLNGLALDQLETLKSALTVMFILAGAFVWLGVYLEKDGFAEATQKIGWRLLVAALLVETIVSLPLWAVDRSVSSKQASEIAATKPRVISQEQHDSIVDALKSTPKGKVLINSAFADSEATQFADEVIGALKDAGFEPQEVPFDDRAFAFEKPGAFLWVKNRNNAPAHAKPIWMALKNAGITLLPQEQPSDVPDEQTVLIAISSHP